MSCQIIGCLSGVTDQEKQSIINRIRRGFGAPIVKVEIDDEQIESELCTAIQEYSSFINDWFLRNKLGEMLGRYSTFETEV